MRPTLSIQRNPEFLYSEDCRLAVSATDGCVHRFDASEQERLLEVGDSAVTLRAEDLALLETGALTPTAAVEHRRVRIAESVRRQWESTGYLTVMPTEKCNFRCTYCYETFLKGKMKPEIVRGLHAYLERNVPTKSVFHLAWFGGEPLLHPSIVAEVSARLRQLQSAHGTAGSISVTTNGYTLNEGVLRTLEPAEIDLYQISLDGPREIHDRQRVTAGGRGTYDEILDNVDRVLESSDSRITLRMNVSPHDRNAAKVTRDWLETSLFPRFEDRQSRVDFHVVPIWDATTTSIEGICLKDLQRFQTWWSIKRAALALESTAPREYLADLVSTAGKQSCYAGKPGSLVVGADGSLYKCTVAFDRSENQIGHLREDGTAEIDPAKEALWTAESFLTDSTCSSCAFALSCQGQFCPLERLDSGIRPCPTEKRFYREILEDLGGATELSAELSSLPESARGLLPILQ